MKVKSEQLLCEHRWLHETELKVLHTSFTGPVDFYKLNFPKNLKKLAFYHLALSDKPQYLVIPESVTSLTLAINYPLHFIVLHSGIQELLLLGNANIEVSGPLPPGIKKMQFGPFFNRKIDFEWPSALEELIFDTQFNQNLVNLPEDLKKLTLSCNFDSRLILPEKLEVFKLSESFTGEVEIPDSLRVLDLPVSWIEELPDFKPPASLETLILGRYGDIKFEELQMCREFLNRYPTVRDLFLRGKKVTC